MVEVVGEEHSKIIMGGEEVMMVGQWSRSS